MLRQRRRHLAMLVCGAVLAAGCGGGSTSGEPDETAVVQADQRNPEISDQARTGIVEVGDDLAGVDNGMPYLRPEQAVQIGNIVSEFRSAAVVAPDIVVVEFLSGVAPCHGISGVDASVTDDGVMVAIETALQRVDDTVVCPDVIVRSRVALRVPGAAPGMQVVPPNGVPASYGEELNPGWERRAESPTDLATVPRPSAARHP